MSGGGSEGGQANITQPDEPTPEQQRLQSVQAQLAEFQLRQLQQQEEIQRAFFGEAFPQQSADQFLRDAETNRRDAEILENKAASLRRGESRVPLTGLASAAKSQVENQAFIAGLDPVTGETRSALPNSIAKKIDESNIAQGVGVAETLENQARMLREEADRFQSQAEELQTAEPSRRSFFTQPLVSQGTRDQTLGLIEKDLASRRPLAPITPAGFGLRPVRNVLGVSPDPFGRDESITQ